MPQLFPELWSLVFLHLSTIDEAANSDAEAWAKVVSGKRVHWNDPQGTLSERRAAQRALGLVSKSYYELSRSVVLEHIMLSTPDQLHHLALTLRTRLQLARVVAQRTKRLDIHFDLQRLPVSTCTCYPPNEFLKHISEDIRLVTRSCGKLTYFSCGVVGTPVDWEPDIPAATLDAHASFEVLSWDSRWKLGLTAHAFSKIRVLDMSMIIYWPDKQSNIHDFPELHTLIGPLRDICSYLQNVNLPCLRTYISTPLLGVGRDLQDLETFFGRNGGRITSLDISSEPFHLRDLLILCPNIREANLNMHQVEWFEKPLRNLRSLGISDVFVDGVRALVLLYMLDILESRRQGGNYPELRTVRFMKEETAQYLRRRHRGAVQLRDRKLRGWAIRLEDSIGDLLAQPP